ncbi:MAG: CHAP domain-containing protein [Verrucomicrobiales bacterium]
MVSQGSQIRRRHLARIARREAERKLAGDANMAGPDIEPYLSVLREAMNRNGSTEIYSDRSRGYNWCCAFVYFCCLQAGFRFPPKPVESYRYTLAAVPAWHHWALAGGFFYPVGSIEIEVGDILLFNRVFDGNLLDHIGIAVNLSEKGIVSAEGNNSNRTGLFSRTHSVLEGIVRLPEDA